MNLGPSPVAWDGPPWAWMIVGGVALAWWAVQLHRWLLRRPLIPWDKKKGWHPWWLVRQ